MPKYTQLLFDIDETLYDLKLSQIQAVKLTLGELGIHCDNETVDIYRCINDELWESHEQGKITREELIDSRFRMLFDRIGVDMDITGVNDAYLLNLGRQNHMIDGAVELCHELKQRGCRLFLVTNGFSVAQRGRVAGSPLHDCFEDIFVSDELNCVKPQPEYFEKVAAGIPDFSKSKALMIGDNPATDILGGNLAGIDTCWYNPTGMECPDDITPSYTVKRLQDIVGIVIQ